MFRVHRPIFRRIHTAVPTWLRLFIEPPGTNGCGNSCVNSPEDGPVGPKHVEIRRYMNKIESDISWFFISYSVYILPKTPTHYKTLTNIQITKPTHAHTRAHLSPESNPDYSAVQPLPWYVG